MTKKKDVLITGGTGFIGSHLAHALFHAGYSVTLLDISPPSSELSKFSFIHQDVTEIDGFMTVLEKDWFAVFHFAAVVSVPQCEQDPELSFKTNFQSVQTLLHTVRIGRESQPQKNPIVIFASSAAVYGNLGQVGKKLSEIDLLPKPTSFYGLHKYASEQSIRMYCERFGLRGISFRFFNVYGPGQKSDSPYSGVITKFNQALESGAGITLFNSGHNERDFIHVSNIVSACVQALALPSDQLTGDVLNLCMGESISIRNVLIQMLKKYHLEEKDVQVTMTGPKLGDIEFSCGNSDAAKKKLNWQPIPQSF